MWLIIFLVVPLIIGVGNGSKSGSGVASQKRLAVFPHTRAGNYFQIGTGK
jgi:hypothetical protein